ncbi:MAG: acyltransferase family protein, partial [Rikenellaceae bacterium]
YLYMLIGIYLILPIISAWIAQAPKKDIQRVIWIWVLTTTLPYLQMVAPLLGYNGNYGNMGILGVCDWNPYGTFYYFSGFLGYVILANYLVRFPLNWSWRKTLSIAIPLWAMGYLITSLGFILTQKYYPGNFAQLEIIWLFTGINVLMMTFPFFIIIQKISFKPSKFLSKLASLTFGVYLCHFLIVQICYDIVYPYIDIAPWLQLPLIAIFAFTVSSVIIWILSRLPKSKYLIG